VVAQQNYWGCTEAAWDAGPQGGDTNGTVDTTNYLDTEDASLLTRMVPGAAAVGEDITLHRANFGQASTVTGTGVTTITYSYDDLYRLSEADYSGAYTATYGYAYDAVGNRTAYTTTITGTTVITYQYDAANRLVESVEVGGDTTTYEWDNAGRLITTTIGVTVSRVYTYSQDGDMLAALVNGLLTTFDYDGDGNRLRMAVAGEVTTYTLDYAGGFRLLLEEGGAFSDTKHYLYGLECIGEQVDVDEPESEWRFYQRDGNSLVRQTTNMLATVCLAWTYSPEGAVLLGEEGPVTNLDCGGSTIYDFSTGLIFKNGSYFDPNTGIWLTMSGVVVYQTGWMPYNRKQKWGKGKKRMYILCLLLLLMLILTACGKPVSVVDPTEVAQVDPTATCTPTLLPPPVTYNLPITANPTAAQLIPPATPLTVTPIPPTGTLLPTTTNVPTATNVPGAINFPIPNFSLSNPFGSERFLVVEEFLGEFGVARDLGGEQGVGHFGLDLVTEKYAIESHKLAWWADDDGESWPTPSPEGREIYSPVFGKIKSKNAHTVFINEIRLTSTSEPIDGLELQFSHVDFVSGLGEGTKIVPGMSLNMKYAGGTNFGTEVPHLHVAVWYNNIYYNSDALLPFH